MSRLGPLSAILDFAGGAALQAVSECPGAARLLLLTKVRAAPGFTAYSSATPVRKSHLFFGISYEAVKPSTLFIALLLGILIPAKSWELRSSHIIDINNTCI